MDKKYNIFLVIFGTATSLANSQVWIRNIFDSLINSGHKVHLCDPQKYLDKANLERYSAESRTLLAERVYNEFLVEHKQCKFDIFFSYLNSNDIEPAFLREVRSQAYTINFTTNFHQFELYKEISLLTDMNIYISKEAKNGFDKLGVKSYWMPLAANEAYYGKYLGQIEKATDISFVGAQYGDRPYLLWRVLQHNLNLEIFGPGWKEFSNIRSLLQPLYTGIRSLFSDSQMKIRKTHNLLRALIRYELNNSYAVKIHGPITDDQYLRQLVASKIFLNIQLSRYNHDFINPHMLLGSNLRDHEVTMAGTFLCTTYSEEVAELYDVKSEICTYANEYELIDKLKYYTKHDAEREGIAQAGRARALAEHTWEKRFSKFFEAVFR